MTCGEVCATHFAESCHLRGESIAVIFGYGVMNHRACGIGVNPDYSGFFRAFDNNWIKQEKKRYYDSNNPKRL